MNLNDSPEKIFGLQPLNDPNLIRFVLVGPNKGKTVILGGFQFERGVCTVPREHEIPVSNILTRYYDAVAERDLYKWVADERERQRVAAAAAAEQKPADDKGKAK